MKSKLWAAGILAVLIGISSTQDALASDRGQLEQVPPARPFWSIAFTPYAWAPAITGNVTARGRTFDVDASIQDVLEALDFGAFGYFEARRKRFGVYADFVYANLGISASAVRQANPIANLSLTVRADVGLRYKLTLIDGGAFYRILDHANHAGCADPDRAHCVGGTSFDLVAGVRYVEQEADVNLAITGVVNVPVLGLIRIGPIARAATGKMHSTDPIFGARLIQDFDRHHGLEVRGDVGGFGVSSDLTWQALAIYNYKFERRDFDIVGQLGYRALGLDYSESTPRGQRGVDYIVHGPVIGLSFRW